jgi:hypothetical protein
MTKNVVRDLLFWPTTLRSQRFDHHPFHKSGDIPMVRLIRRSILGPPMGAATSVLLASVLMAQLESRAMSRESQLAIQTDIPEIAVQEYDLATHRVFAETMLGLRSPQAEPYRAVIVNRSSQAIEALLLRWTLMSSQAPPRFQETTIDNYFRDARMPKQSIALPGQAVLVSPGSYVRQPNGKGSGTSGVSTRPAKPDLVMPLQRAELTVDAVLFEDGLLVGPNRFGLTLDLKERKDVAEELARRVRAEQSPEKVRSIIEEFRARPRMVIGPSQKAQWGKHLADLMSQHFSALDLFEHLPELPPIHGR